MSTTMSANEASSGPVVPKSKISSLTRAQNTINYMLDPKSGGPQPARLRTRAFLRSLRYATIFLFWRLVRYGKYAAVGALVAAISGTAIGSIVSGAAFVIAPTGILGGAGVGLLWAVGKFGWRRATARVRRRGEHEPHADPRQDEVEAAHGAGGLATVPQPKEVEPW